MAVCKADSPVLFKKALESVYASSLLPAQMVLVCDGPLTPALEDVLAFYSPKPGFEILRLAQQCGLAAALNAGLSRVCNELIFRADSDDINLPNRFEKQLEVLLAGYDLVGSAILEVDESRRPVAIRNMPDRHEQIAKFLRHRNPLNHMTVAMRKSTIDRVGNYPDIYLREDYALWAKVIAGGGKAANLNEVLVIANAGEGLYRRRGGLRYALGEIPLQSLLYRLGHKSILEALLHGLIRGAVFLIPPKIRGGIYKKLLRDRVPEKTGEFNGS